MITVTIYRNKHEEIMGFEVKGHANSDIPGKDLVCCAVSVTTIGAVHAIEKVALVSPLVVEKKDGYLCIKYSYRDQGDEKAQTILESMAVILHSIQDEHPKYVQVKEEHAVAH